MIPTFHSSKGCTWVRPRQPLSEAERFKRHGKVQPMEPINPRRELLIGGPLLLLWIASLIGLCIAFIPEIV